MTKLSPLSLLVLLLVGGTAIVGAESATKCSIDCLHNTTCVLGEANFTWHPVKPDSGEQYDFSKEISRNGYHCGCPPGLTGLRCGRTYESCGDANDAHTCFNGGKCIATLKDIYQNDQQYCDCPSTVDDSGNTVRYSGKYCEVEVISKNTRCDQDNNICQNGGTCKKTVDEMDPCDCPEGYVGRMCEFYEPAVPKCSLTCQNGGSCRLGTKTEDHNLVLNEPGKAENQSIHVVHENYMYCECPSGFQGVYCETDVTVCGDIKCHHGSTCVSVENKDKGETTYHCDCNAVNAKHLENGKTFLYAGRHCEIPSTTLCRYEKRHDTNFCTHEGICPVQHYQPCICRPNYHGTRCEFRTNETTVEEPHAKCMLQCKNGGECRKGTKQDPHIKELVGKYGGELAGMGLNITHNDDFEHCACPDGFVGVECEYSMKTCGHNGEEHPCFHGSTCDMVNDVPTCICDEAETSVAGIYCQHKPSDVCKVGDVPSADGNRGFCVNGGVCVANKDGEAACRCHSKWEGPHCEYAKNSTSSSTSGSSSSASASSTATTAAAGTGLEVTTMSDQSAATNTASGMSGPAKFGITLIILVCGTVMAFGVVVYRRQRILTEADVAPVYPDLNNNLALDDESFRAAPVVDVGPERDFDGNELKDVEFT